MPSVSAARRASASADIDRNLRMENGSPLRPIRSCR